MSAAVRGCPSVCSDRDERSAGCGCLTDGCRVAADLLERRRPRALVTEGDRDAAGMLGSKVKRAHARGAPADQDRDRPVSVRARPQRDVPGGEQRIVAVDGGTAEKLVEKLQTVMEAPPAVLALRRLELSGCRRRRIGGKRPEGCEVLVR